MPQPAAQLSAGPAEVVLGASTNSPWQHNERTSVNLLNGPSYDPSAAAAAATMYVALAAVRAPAAPTRRDAQLDEVGTDLSCPQPAAHQRRSC
jgi:hypothetical protein